MVALKRQEILDRLKKLGINSESELESYIEEYNAYFGLQKEPKNDKRAYSRISIGVGVKIFYNNDIFQGTVLNVSERGMFIGTNQYFSSDSMICIESDSLKVLAIVKRLKKMNGNYGGVGVELINPAHDYFDYLKAIKPPQ